MWYIYILEVFSFAPEMCKLQSPFTKLWTETVFEPQFFSDNILSPFP